MTLDPSLKQDWINWLDKVKTANIDRGAVEATMIDKLGSLDGFEADLDRIFGPPAAQPALVHMARDQVIESLTRGGAKRHRTDKADLYTVAKFFTPKECQYLATMIKANLRKSTLLGKSADKAFRTSSSCDLNLISDPFRVEIDKRISDLLGVDDRLSEKMQGQHYDVGQEFKPHMDYFHGDQIIQESRGKGQRSWTFMVYLNSTKAGGETVFTELDIAFKPKPGLALVWNNMRPDGRSNPDTMHHARPIKAGNKTIITKWFRQYSPI